MAYFIPRSTDSTTIRYSWISVNGFIRVPRLDFYVLDPLDSPLALYPQGENVNVARRVWHHPTALRHVSSDHRSRTIVA